MGNTLLLFISFFHGGYHKELEPPVPLEGEGSGFWLHKEMGSSEFIIAVKFFTKRVLNIEAVTRTFKQLWRSRNVFKIKDLGIHIYCSSLTIN